jgi:PAS domain S-box-containing protein
MADIVSLVVVIQPQVFAKALVVTNPNEHPSPASLSTQLNVLLVDDVPENLELLQDLLEERGYHVIATASSLEALSIVERETIHVIVADALMPKMDGLELCQKVKQHPSRVGLPFIIYTRSYVDKEDEDLARSIGVDRYLMKFGGTATLLEAVDELALRRYGVQGDGVSGTAATLDDHAFLERHHTIVTKKLDEKMKELEIYAETLEKKNRELIVSERRYRTLFENASAAIIVVSPRPRRIVEVNHQALVFLGAAEGELALVDHLPFVDNDGTRVDLLALRHDVTHECRIPLGNGDYRDVDITAGPVDQARDGRIMLFIRDITESKRMRDHLLQSEKMALMGRLAAGIAHEIRNPLAGVALNLQYLGLKIPVDSTDHESIDAALEGTQRIQQVIDDTLGLARVSPPCLREESMNAVIERTLHFLSSPLRQKNISILSRFAEPLPPVLMDAKQVQQVLLNILQNAIDASPVESSIDVATASLMAQGIPSISITVQDSGPGFTADTARRAFEGFHTTKEGGTGLGLMLSKFIIDRHRGTIALDNAPGGGAVVRLIFQASTMEEEPQHA